MRKFIKTKMKNANAGSARKKKLVHTKTNFRDFQGQVVALDCVKNYKEVKKDGHKSSN